MSDLNEFRKEAEALGAKWLPGHPIKVGEYDFGNIRGVAVSVPEKDLRQAVKGRAHGRWIPAPRWWQVRLRWKAWRNGTQYPVYLPPLSAPAAIGALAKWVIERDMSCARPVALEDNEEPLS
jgi:hypothetical protein